MLTKKVILMRGLFIFCQKSASSKSKLDCTHLFSIDELIDVLVDGNFLSLDQSKI